MAIQVWNEPTLSRSLSLSVLSHKLSLPLSFLNVSLTLSLSDTQVYKEARVLSVCACNNEEVRKSVCV